MTKHSPASNAGGKSRYFTALIPPPALYDAAAQLKAHFRDSYHSKAALRSPPHITLNAPFEWPDGGWEQLLRVLQDFTAGVGAVPVEINGFGAFPPRVIYLAVDHTPELMRLQGALSQHLAKNLDIVDPRSYNQPFCPHLTVAFRDLKPAAFHRAWPEFQNRSVAFSFTATRFALLRHTGQGWTIDRDFPLQ